MPLSSHPYSKPAEHSLTSAQSERKYPLKWAICYRGKPYIALYGKKKAHDLLYKLNQSMVGLSIIPLEPGINSDTKTPVSINKKLGQKNATAR